MLAMIFALSSSAHAYGSEPQHVVLTDLADLFDRTEIDTGWLPTDSPLQVRFQIASTGGAAVLMEGDAYLSWPEALTLAFKPEPGTGALLVDTTLSAITSVRFDVAGYEWDAEVDRRDFTIAGETFFDPFTQDDGTPDHAEVIFAGDRTELVSFDFDVFTGVSAQFSMPMVPTATTTFDGVSWTVEGTDLLIYQDDVATVTPTGEATQAMSAVFQGHWEDQLDLVLVPTFTVCVAIIGCWDLISFEIPVPLASDNFVQDFPTTDLAFPLPVLSTPSLTYDVGDVLVGNLANVNLPITNLGDLDLEGTAGLLGSSWFSVYPNYFQAAPGAEDGMVITFAPADVGEVSATIMLDSNDPLQPVVEVLVTGRGVLPDEEGEGDGDTASEETTTAVVTEDVKGGCGCATSGAGAPALLGLGGLLALLRRRREPQA